MVFLCKRIKYFVFFCQDLKVMLWINRWRKSVVFRKRW